MFLYPSLPLNFLVDMDRWKYSHFHKYFYQSSPLFLESFFNLLNQLKGCQKKQKKHKINI